LRFGSEQITYSPCSVGGADYGSVRVGTFMGRRIIQGTASKLANSFKKTRDEADDVELALSTEDAEEEYLCNIPPHRYTPLNRQSLCAPLSTRSEELVAVLLHAEVKMYLALQCRIFRSIIFWEYSAATCFNCVSHLFKSTILPHQT